MNEAELKAKFKLLMPDEIQGNKRPSEPLASDNDFFLDVPQLIAKDPVINESMNLILSVGLSNDNYLKGEIEDIQNNLNLFDYRTATTTLKGLMSPADKAKLDSVTAGANNYTHPTSGVKAGTYKSVTVDTYGHVTAGSNPTTLAGYGITDAPTKTGSGATGTWNISINGTANKANSATTATTATSAVKALTANVLTNSGNVTAITSGAPPTGLTVAQAYNNGYPIAYGNVLRVGAQGAGELLMGWSGTDNAKARLYYRNKKDICTTWSDWSGIAWLSDANPPGTIIMYAANTTPDGYLLCDGRAVSRTTYAELFTAIGTTWGAGDGSTTFNLPNATNRFPEGSTTAGKYFSAGLPNITGTISGALEHGPVEQAGAFWTASDNERALGIDGSDYDNPYLRFDASRSNSIYGASDTVQPPAFTVRYMIKY